MLTVCSLPLPRKAQGSGLMALYRDGLLRHWSAGERLVARGLPATGLGTPGNAAAVLDHGRFGLLIDPEDIQGVARAIGTQVDCASALFPESQAENYDLSRTMAKWQGLIDELRQPASLPPCPA